MGRSSAVTDAVARLERSIKRTSSIWNKDGQGRSQGRTLKVLAENDGCKASELARLLNLSPSSLSEKLQKLEEDGNIERIRDKKDLRVVRVYVTEKGKETIKNRKDSMKKAKRDFTEVLSDEEVTHFEDMCERLTASLDEIYIEERKKTIEILKLQRELESFDTPAFKKSSNEKLG